MALSPLGDDIAIGTFSQLVKSIKGNDCEPATVPRRTLVRWHRDIQQAREMSFARGYLLGRALAAQKAQVQRGEVEAWARETVGVTPQLVNLYIRGFEAIEKQLVGDGDFVIPANYSFTGWVADRCPMTGAGPRKQKRRGGGVGGRPDQKVAKLAIRWLARWGGLLLNELGDLGAEGKANQVAATAGELRDMLGPIEAGTWTPASMDELIEHFALLTALSQGLPPSGVADSGPGALRAKSLPSPQARRHRAPLHRTAAPTSWSQVGGHDEAKRTLIGFVESGLRNNLLLLGESGIGKTTLANLYVKAQLCERRVGRDPCGRCAACTESDTGLFFQGCGVLTISGTADDPDRVIRELAEHVGYCRAVVLNEADRLLSKSQRLIDLMERHQDVIFVLTAITDAELEKYAKGQVHGRCKVITLKPLQERELIGVLDRAHRERVGGPLSAGARQHVLTRLADREVSGRVRDALQELDGYLAAGEPSSTENHSSIDVHNDGEEAEG